MGFCIGGAWCRKQDCRKRCESWFGTMPDVMDSCKARCNDSTSFTRDEYLCSGNNVDIGTVMLRYKTDPCPDDNILLSDLLDPLGREDDEIEAARAYTPLIIGIALIMLTGLIYLITNKKKS